MAPTQENDIEKRFTQHLRGQHRHEGGYECDQCSTALQTDEQLWSHYEVEHASLVPKDEGERRKFRIKKKDDCRRKARPAISQKTHRIAPALKNGSNANNNCISWQIQDSPAREKQDGSLGPASGEMRDIERGTSSICLKHNGQDQPMQDAPPPQLEALSATSRPGQTIISRKRTGGTDAAFDGVGSPPQQATHSIQSPKRTRSAPVNRGAMRTAPGAGRNQRRKPEIDPDFDRSLSRYQQSDPQPDDQANAQGHSTRRLFDPERDNVGTFKAEKPEEHPKRLDDYPMVNPQNLPRPAGTDSRNQGQAYRSKREQKKKDPKLYHHQSQKDQHRSSNAEQRAPPHSQRQPSQPQPVKPTILKPQPQVSPEEYDPNLDMVRQPETRPISTEQLIAEVKGIYAGLVMVETKCCEVDAKQALLAQDVEGSQHMLNNEQWQALIALHRTLLHEHHDFFLASQHPSASPSLRRLAQKYAMPARMWRHGIHSFLELLRHRLPESFEHMLAFIYLAYSMMALLYETVPAFEDTWIECLGDLGRYRMAIEDEDIKDREVWTNVARFWYSKAADKTPSVGRLYHHLAILARNSILQQLFYYCKSLAVSVPFSSARESILTLFDPILNGDVQTQKSLVDALFVKLHGINFTNIGLEKFEECLDEFLDILDKHIGNAAAKWKVQGCYIAISNITGLFQYGAKNSLLRQAYREGRNKNQTTEEEMEDGKPSGGDLTADYDGLLPPLPDEATSEHATSVFQPVAKGLRKEEGTNEKNKVEKTSAIPLPITEEHTGDEGSTIQHVSLDVGKRLAFKTLALVLERIGDENVLPHILCWMVFLVHVKNSDRAIKLLEIDFPWEGLIALLNELFQGFCEKSREDSRDRITGENFPLPEKNSPRYLPEDYILRGLDWSRKYFPDGWFDGEQVDPEERALDLPSFTNMRTERVLWLAFRLCATGDWLFFENDNFSIHPALVARIRLAKQKAALIAEKYAKPTTTIDEDSDLEMTGENEFEEDYVMVTGQSEQVRQLKEEKRRLESQLRVGKMDISENTENNPTPSKALEELLPNYTVLVVDTNLLVQHLDFFKLMIKTTVWAVVIPNCVVTELHGLTRNTGNVGDNAREALKVISSAVDEKRNLKVVTAKGNNVTTVGFYKEQLNNNGTEDHSNIDDVVIQVTKQQGEAKIQLSGARGVPAVLITEDRNMRVKARARGVTAFSASRLRLLLEQEEAKDCRTPPEISSSGMPLPSEYTLEISTADMDMNATNVKEFVFKGPIKRDKIDVPMDTGIP
ncbi:hypothetical protein RUND412_002677 [Rhizina undulata]